MAVPPFPLSVLTRQRYWRIKQYWRYWYALQIQRVWRGHVAWVSEALFRPWHLCRCCFHGDFFTYVVMSNPVSVSSVYLRAKPVLASEKSTA